MIKVRRKSGGSPTAPIPSLQVNGNYIDLVKETKYLGLMIDDNLKWESNVKCTQCHRPRKAGHLLTYKVLWKFPPASSVSPPVVPIFPTSDVTKSVKKSVKKSFQKMMNLD